MNEFSWPLRVYYEDTDCGGVVYYANYLKFMERARTEWLRAFGFEQDRLRSDHGVLFAVRSAQVEYLRPALFNDALEVTVRAVEQGRASLTVDQDVRRVGPAPEVLCTGRIRLACLAAESLRPSPIPDVVWREITVGR